MTGPLSKSPNAISKSGIPLSCRELPIRRIAQINTERYAEDGCHDELVRPLARCRASGELFREPLQPGRLLHAESALRRALDRQGRGRPRARGGSEPRGFLHPAAGAFTRVPARCSFPPLLAAASTRVGTASSARRNR